jgi:hypothetical protein
LPLILNQNPLLGAHSSHRQERHFSSMPQLVPGVHLEEAFTDTGHAEDGLGRPGGMPSDDDASENARDEPG